MRIIHAARILLGLGFVAFAVNYFVPFLPPQDAPPAEAMPFLAGFAGSGMLTLVKLIELGAGLLLLSNRFVPLALALLAPIVVGILAFHLLLAPAGTPIAVVFLVLELGLAWGYRAAFAPMLRATVIPEPVVANRPLASPAIG
ncbi:MAG: DoxX family protein [Deltaproteobacteria bacterium]|nr:DoxX family protein [Deltaproteobacteria bacterium]